MAGKSKRKKKKKKSAFSRAVSSIFPCKGDGFLESLRKIVFLLSITVFAVCAYLIFDYFYENYCNSQLYDSLAEGYENTVTEQQVTDEQQQAENQEPKLLPGAEYLLSINPDTVGYIEIPGMDISYPIVQRPNAKEGEHYLHINFMNEQAKAGAIFLDWRNKFNAKEY
jgi:sortase B